MAQREIPLGIVSAHPQRYLEQELKSYGLFQCFDTRYVFGGSTNKARDMLSIVLSWNGGRELTQEEHQSYVYFGDMKSDIVATKAAGLQSVAITEGWHKEEWLREENPDHLIPNLAYVRALFDL